MRRKESERLRPKADWRIVVRDAKTMKVLRETRKSNILTSVGLALFAQAMDASPFIAYGSTRYYWYLVLGTGVGVPAAGDTGLWTPIAASSKHGSLSQTGTQYQYYVRYMPEDANGYTYKEAGIYDKVGGTPPDDYTTGTLLNHLVIADLTKTADILVDFYVTITFS